MQRSLILVIVAVISTLGASRLAAANPPASSRTAKVRPRPLGKHKKAVYGLDISANGKLALSASADRTVALWDLRKGRRLSLLEGHHGKVAKAVFSPRGLVAASAGYDKTVRVWDLKKARQLRELKSTNFVWSVAFSSDGKHLAYGTDTGIVRFVEVKTGKLVHQHGAKSGAVSAIVFLPGRPQALFASGDRLRLVDFRKKSQTRQFAGHKRFVTSVDVDPTGKLALSGSWDGSARLWEISSGKTLRELKGSGDCVHGVAFLSGSQRAVTASGGRYESVSRYSDGVDNALRIWEVSEDKPMRTLPGHTTPVRCVAASPNGKIIISGSEDGSVFFWLRK